MLEPKHVVRLFARMLHLYGHKWHSVYGSAVEGQGASARLTASALLWQNDLRDYSPEQVAVGIQAVIDRRLEWPPGPIEFANLCDGIPSVAMVLDRANDYGPVCAEIRRRLDWWNLDNLPSAKVAKAVEFGMDRAIVAIKRDGTMAAIQAAQREALAAEKQEALA